MVEVYLCVPVPTFDFLQKRSTASPDTGKRFFAETPRPVPSSSLKRNDAVRNIVHIYRGGGPAAPGQVARLLPGGRCPGDPEHSWIVHGGDTSFAADMAAAQGVRAVDLRRKNIVDRIVAEHASADTEPPAFSRRMGSILAQEMSVLLARPSGERLARRTTRYAF